MLPIESLSRGGPRGALTRHAEAMGTSDVPFARDHCMYCGKLRPVFSTVRVDCVEGRTVFAPLCGSCTRQVGG